MRLRAQGIRSRSITLLIAVFLAVSAHALFASAVAAQGLTDGLNHPPTTGGAFPFSPPGSWLPGSPGFPAAGTTYVDPVFGATVRRLTNEFPAPNNSDIYAKNGWWNANGTRFFERTQTDFLILDSATGAVVRSGVPGGSVAFDASFDPDEPCHQRHRETERDQCLCR